MEAIPAARERYPSDVSDDGWAFVALYLTLMTDDAPQRRYPLGEVCNGLRYIVHPALSRGRTPDLRPLPRPRGAGLA
jgi:hypothetical protein